ncbi:MAG: GYF domain-containing protein [Verrucomicrobiota bacterium]
MSQWYYALDKKQQGPVSAAELKSLFQQDKISEETLVWNKSMTDWKKLKQVLPDLNSAPEPAAASGPATTPATGAQTPGTAQSELSIQINLAIGSLVSGILGIPSCCCGFLIPFCCILIPLPIAAVVLGHLTLNRASIEPLDDTARVMAIIGLVLGYGSILMTLFTIALHALGFGMDQIQWEDLMQQLQDARA